MDSTNKKIKIALVSGGIDSAYNSAFATCLAGEFSKFDFHIIWYQSIANEDFTGKPHEVGEMNIYNLINYSMIDAVIMLSSTMKSQKAKEDVISRAAENGVPLISVDEMINGAYNIAFDYEDSIEDLVRHVIEKHGAKNINFIGGMKGNPLSDSRENIYRRVLEEHNIPVDEKRIGYAYFWHEPAADLFEKWHKEGLVPDAVVCANDSMAIGVCNKAAELGYNIPEDLIVTGVDGIDEAMTYVPSMTTAKINIKEASKRIGEIVSLILSGKQEPSGCEKIKAERIYSQSCGCKPLTAAKKENTIKHYLYEDINKFKGMTKSFIDTADEIVIDADFNVTVERLRLFMEKIWTKSAWICICDDFISKIGNTEDVYSGGSGFRREGYSEYIGYGIQYCSGDKTLKKLPFFRTSELLPNIEEVFDKYHNITLQPLHFQDRTIGYIAVEFDYCMGNFSMLNTFDCSVISLVLENARVQCELRSFAKMLEEMYVHDPMTKLLNRRGFYKFVPKIYEDCVAGKQEFMIVSADLDNLKGINDNYGHAEGDNAIIKIAEALTNASDGRFITARFGGDEYVAAGICPSEEFSTEYINKINKYLDEYNKNSGKSYTVDASCGVYKAVPAEGVSLDEFITEADAVMYSVKRRRKKGRQELARKRM